MPLNATSRELALLVKSAETLIANFKAHSASLSEVSKHLTNLMKIFDRLAPEDNRVDRHIWFQMNTALKGLKDATSGTIAERKSDNQEAKELRQLAVLQCEAAIMKLGVFEQMDAAALSAPPSRTPPAPPAPKGVPTPGVQSYSSSSQYSQIPGNTPPKVPQSNYGALPDGAAAKRGIMDKASIVNASSSKQTKAHLPGSVDPQLEASRLAALQQATKDLEALVDAPKAAPVYGQIPTAPLIMKQDGALKSNAPKPSRTARTGAGNVAEMLKEEAKRIEQEEAAANQSTSTAPTQQNEKN